MTLIYSLNSVNKSWQPEFLQKKKMKMETLEAY